MKHFVLIGFSGCGKSTAGRLAAKALGLPFYDSDHEIEKEYGCTITDIFADRGEEAFRAIETDMLSKLASYSRCVIATGGGCVTLARNMQLFAENAYMVYLKATPEKILSNIRHDTARPLLQTEDKMAAIRRLMNERLPLYDAYAQITLDVSNISRKEAVDALTDTMRRRL